MYGLKYIGAIENDRQLFRGQEEVVIYGNGRVGHRIFDYLCEHGIGNKVVCFCDQKAEIMEQSNQDISVLKVKDAISQYHDAIFIVSGVYAAEMFLYLSQLRVSNIHIILW